MTRESGQGKGLWLRLVFCSWHPPPPPSPTPVVNPACWKPPFPSLDTRKVAGSGRGLASSWGKRAWAQALRLCHMPQFNGAAGYIGVWGRAWDARHWRVCGKRARLAPALPPPTAPLPSALWEPPTPGCTRWKVFLPGPRRSEANLFPHMG